MITSPLRYPGGKGQLYKQIKQIILDNDLCDKTYTEPFAGGYGLGIKLLLNNDVKHAIINDFDYTFTLFGNAFFLKQHHLLN